MKDYSFLVASDMDYTLIMPGKPVSPANKKAVRAVREAGGAFTLATGRTFYLTGSYARDLDISIPLITSNGAALSDPRSFSDISSVNFPPDLIKLLLELFLKNGIDATGYGSDGVFFFPASTRRGFISDYNRTVSNDIRVATGEISGGDEPLPSFNKFLLISPPEHILNLLSGIDPIQTVSSAHDFYDVMMKGPSKGKAMLDIADSLDIPGALTFALGDSENDLSLLDAAGHAIAMENSAPEILNAADYITGDCESDGFAKAVFEYILPEAKKIIKQGAS